MPIEAHINTFWKLNFFLALHESLNQLLFSFIKYLCIVSISADILLFNF